MVAAVGCGGEKAADKQGEGGEEAKQKLVAAFEPTFAPFESTDENGEFVGFDIDLIKAIAEEQGFEVELKSLSFDGLIPALQTGQIDVIVSGMSIKPKREEQVNFSIPYYEAPLVIAVREDNNEITKPEDLAGKRIAVQIGTTGADKANEFKEKYGAEVKTYNTVDLVFNELINGGVDAVINDEPVTEEFIEKKGQGKVKIVGDTLVGDYYGIAVAKENTELLESINEGLKKLKENGKFNQLYEKWFHTSAPDYLPGERS
nr:basic amino acid ABC transporter substrate-binding protein [Desulforadius tongensis]